LARLGPCVIPASMSRTDPFFIRSLSSVGRAMRKVVDDDMSPRAEFVKAVRNRPMSMLSADTLKAVHLLSGMCDRAIVEIGAYVGGATVTILHATQERRNIFVTIEEPVEHPTHPDIPTRNTVDDLRTNIRSFGLGRESHYIVPGTSFESWVLGTLHHRLLGNPIGLLVWDADAAPDKDLFLLSPYLGEGCLLVIDDYTTGNIKSGRITTVVDDLVRRRIIAPIAHLPWATWFGRLLRKPTPSEIAEYRADWRRLADEGNPYYQRLLDYEKRLTSGAPDPLTFDERMEFWKRASAYSS
jgi:hypothetical protein